VCVCVCVCVYIYIYIYRFIAPKFVAVHVELQNCCYNQFTTLSLHVFMLVTARHIDVSAVKKSHNEEKTLRPIGGELQQEMLCPFVYIFSILPVEIR